MKSYFLIKDNVLDKKLSQYVDDKSFSSKKNIKTIINEIIQSFADRFTESNFNKAKQQLEKRKYAMRSRDIGLMSFFAGTILILLFELIFSMQVPLNHEDVRWDLFEGSFPSFRCALMLNLFLFLLGLDIYILRAYRINYPFIFELDPQYKITHIQIFRYALFFTAIMLFCLHAQFSVIKLKYFFEQSLAFFTLALTLFIAIMFVLPFHVFYLRARKALYIALMHIFISPFGKVKFRHFFLADILTSLTLTFRDAAISLTFFFSGNWLNSEPVVLSDHKGLTVYYYSVGLVTSWFRLA